MNVIRHIRKRVLGLRQRELASVMGVSTSRLSNLENDLTEARHSELRAIRTHALARGLPWSDAVFFEAPPPAPDNSRRRAA